MAVFQGCPKVFQHLSCQDIINNGKLALKRKDKRSQTRNRSQLGRAFNRGPKPLHFAFHSRLTHSSQHHKTYIEYKVRHRIVDEEILTSSIPEFDPAKQHSEGKVEKPLATSASSTAETSGVCFAPLWAFGPFALDSRPEHPSHHVFGSGQCLQDA